MSTAKGPTTHLALKVYRGRSDSARAPMSSPGTVSHNPTVQNGKEPEMKKQAPALGAPSRPICVADIETLGLLLVAIHELAVAAEGGAVRVHTALAAIGTVAEVGQRMARELAEAAPQGGNAFR